MHVDDNCEIILELMLSKATDESYNIGSGYHYKNIEIINFIGETLGKEIKRDFVADRLGHDRSYRLNNNKASEFLGDKVFQTLEGFLKDEIRRA
jgi:dTDP-D-glucose 4,6-dehydratase